MNIRKSFDILKNKKFIYFDNAAMGLRPNPVVKKITDINRRYSFNVGRGIYDKAFKTSLLYENARSAVAEFINADKDEIVFTSNTTQALNFVALSFAKSVLKPGDEIITSKYEHHSSVLPYVKLAKETGAKLVYVPLNRNHKITLENFKKVLSKKTKIVALSYISNVLGAITPMKQIIEYAHKKGAYVVVDGAQAVSHFEVDVKNLNCDFFAFSGYKIGSSTGAGVLYGKRELLEKMEPLFLGGGSVLNVDNDNIDLKSVPHKFEAGTQNIAEVISLHEAIKFINKVKYSTIVKRDEELKQYLLEQLALIKEVKVYNKYCDIALVSFNIEDVHAHDAATMYNQYGICVRAGHHCAQPLINYLGQTAVIRVSLNYYNTKQEIDKFIEVTNKIIDFFSV